MQQTRLGRTNIAVSRIGFGGLQIAIYERASRVKPCCTLKTEL